MVEKLRVSRKQQRRKHSAAAEVEHRSVARPGIPGVLHGGDNPATSLAIMASTGLRFLKTVGESSFWRRAGKVHAWLYRRTGGRIGHWSGHVNSLLLTTTGRKSGQPRTVPLAYLADGDSFVLVASNGGADRHPAWWLNLEHTPEATIQVGKERLDVVATRADAAESARLWPRLKEVNPFFGWYEQITDRDIPVVVLRPQQP